MTQGKSPINDNEYDEREQTALDRWFDKGSPLTRKLKIIGATTLGFAIMIGIIAAPIAEQREEGLDVVDALNSQDTITFTSHQDCVAKGFEAIACYDSQENALRLSEIFKDPIEPMDMKDCAEKFGNCPSRQLKSHIWSGAEIYNYRPTYSGWQATANDLNTALPLYKLSKENTYLRVDGQLVYPK